MPASEMFVSELLRAAADKMDASQKQETSDTSAERVAGEDIQFSLAKPKASSPLSLEPGNRDVVDRINRSLLGRTKIDMRPTFEDMPDEVKEAADRAGIYPNEFRGATIGPRIYVAQDAHSSMGDVQRTILYELYGHYGLRALSHPSSLDSSEVYCR